MFESPQARIFSTLLSVDLFSSAGSLPCYAGGREFKSRRPRHFSPYGSAFSFKLSFARLGDLKHNLLHSWAYEHVVTMDFSRPGEPMDNAMIESFNGSFRDECLNVNWYLPMEAAREKIEK